jgi:carboxypeptidase PM20D1
VHATFKRELINGDALLYRWQDSDPGALPVLLMAHQDVVPVEPGTEGEWTHPPFDGVIADGFVWGRGALDDKGSLVTLFEALEALLAEGFRPTRDVYLVSGFDEEVGGAPSASPRSSRNATCTFCGCSTKAAHQAIVTVSGQAPRAGPQWLRGLSPPRAAPLDYDKPAFDGFTLTPPRMLERHRRSALVSATAPQPSFDSTPTRD